MDPIPLPLSAYCGAAALLSLDETYVGQWMLSRPFVVGPLNEMVGV